GQKVRDLGPAEDDIRRGDIADERPVRTQFLRSVLGAAFLPGGQTVLSWEYLRPIHGMQDRSHARERNEVRLWDGASARLLRSFTLTGPPSSFGKYALSPDGKPLAVTDPDYRADPSIRLWDTQTGERVGRLDGHPGSTIASLAFSPDGHTLASGGQDTTVL